VEGHSVRHELTNQWFAGKITKLVDHLMPHKEFLRQLRATGGRATIIIQFLGGYLSDAVPSDTLAKTAECNWISVLSAFAFARPNHDRKFGDA